MDLKLLDNIDKNSNVLFTEDQVKMRQKNKFWSYEKLEKKVDRTKE